MHPKNLLGKQCLLDGGQHRILCGKEVLLAVEGPIPWKHNAAKSAVEYSACRLALLTPNIQAARPSPRRALSELLHPGMCDADLSRQANPLPHPLRSLNDGSPVLRKRGRLAACCTALGRLGKSKRHPSLPGRGAGESSTSSTSELPNPP